MSLREHVKYSGLASIILVPFIKFKVLAFFAGAVLIDVDHYIDYIIKFRSFSIHDMFEYNKRIFVNQGSTPYFGLSVFHTVEFLVLFYALSCMSMWLWFIWLGMVFHWGLDIVFLYRIGYTFDRAHSIIEYLIRIKSHKAANQKIDASWCARCQKGISRAN